MRSFGFTGSKKADKKKAKKREKSCGIAAREEG
jgi:hypothetical protein